MRSIAETELNDEQASVPRDGELIVMVKRGADGRLYRVGGPQMPKSSKSESTACAGTTSSAVAAQSDIGATETTASAEHGQEHISEDVGRCAEPNCPYSDVEGLVWIQCDACCKWYHCVCISGYNVNVAPNWKYFFCSCFRPVGCP